MSELKNAYEVLGLNENASREELEKRFEFLMRKNKAAILSEGEEKENANLNMDEISNAYNKIISIQLDLIEKEEEKRNPRKPNPIFKLLKVDEKKARNYIYYHKFHYILGLIGLLVLIYMVKTIVFQVNPEMNMGFIGPIYYNDTSILKEKIETAIPEIKGIGFDGAMLTGDLKNPQESAMVQKVMVLFAAGNMDIYILDKTDYLKFANQGAFNSLDSVVSSLEIDKSKYQDLILKPQEETKEHVYGIDISNSSLLKESKIAGKEMIVAFKIDTKKFDKSVKILQLLLK